MNKKTPEASEGFWINCHNYKEEIDKRSTKNRAANFH